LSSQFNLAGSAPLPPRFWGLEWLRSVIPVGLIEALSLGSFGCGAWIRSDLQRPRRPSRTPRDPDGEHLPGHIHPVRRGSNTFFAASSATRAGWSVTGAGDLGHSPTDPGAEVRRGKSGFDSKAGLFEDVRDCFGIEFRAMRQSLNYAWSDQPTALVARVIGARFLFHVGMG
jgi:hypothetical protein